MTTAEVKQLLSQYREAAVIMAEAKIRLEQAESTILSLVPGAAVVVLDRQPFGGPMRVSASGREQLLGAELAGVLLCARAEAR